MTTAAQDRAPGATIEPPTEAELAALRILFADFRYFSVEAIERAGDRSIALRAWASTPTDEPAGFSLRVNGREVATAVLKLSGASERRHFAFWPDRPAYAINGVADLSRIPASDQGYKFECMNGDPPERFPRSQDYYVPPYWADCLDRWARPPADSVQRTTPRLARPAWAGQQDLHAHWFFFGYSNIWNIDDILVSTLGRSVRETGRVLDWGCGCGRVTQHLARIPGCQTFGADIDAANVLWARDNIPGAAFEVIGLDPPMPYADDFFDLIIGLSVFTHLSEASQFEWLRELRRVLKPGGILVASVAGHTALKKATLENALRFFRRTQARGFSDEMLGGEFRDMLRHRPTYYRNTRASAGICAGRVVPLFRDQVHRAGRPLRRAGSRRMREALITWGAGAVVPWADPAHPRAQLLERSARLSRRKPPRPRESRVNRRLLMRPCCLGTSR